MVMKLMEKMGFLGGKEEEEEGGDGVVVVRMEDEMEKKVVGKMVEGVGGEDGDGGWW